MNSFSQFPLFYPAVVYALPSVRMVRMAGGGCISLDAWRNVVPAFFRVIIVLVYVCHFINFLFGNGCECDCDCDCDCDLKCECENQVE